MEAENKGAQRLKNWTSLSPAQKFEICIDIFKKPFEERTEGDIALLIKSTEGISFFQELGRESHKDCCNYLTFSSAEKDEVIIKEGDVGSTFYIILQGSVGVHRFVTQEVPEAEKKTVAMPSLILRDKGESNSPGTPRSPKAGAHSLGQFDDQIIMSPEKGRVRNKFTAAANSMMFLSAMTKKKEEKVLTEQAVLTIGSSFGERALVSNARRKATIIAKETTYFAVLEKKYFNQTIKEREMKIHNENITFLSTLNYLKVLSYHAVEQIYYLSKKQKFNKNQPIYSEGDPSEFIYIIRSGQFKILKQIEIKQEVDPLHDPNSGVIRKKKPTRRNAEITILTPGELFGEFEVMEGIPRESSILCDSSEAELYILSKNLFVAHIYSDTNAKMAIDKQRQVKTDQHKKRLQLIEAQTNKNKNLLVHLENRQKPRVSQAYHPFSNSAFVDPTEKSEASFQRNLETEPNSEYFNRESNGFKDKPNSIFLKYKETMSYVNNLSSEKREQIRMNSPKFAQASSNMQTSKSTPKILIHSYDKRKRKSGSTLVGKLNLPRSSLDVPVRSPVNDQRKIRTQIITNTHSQNFFTTAQSAKPSLLCLWDKDKSPSGESPMGIASISLDKRDSCTNRRPSYRTTPRARLSKDNSATVSFNEKVSDSINMAVPKYCDSPLRVRESISIDKDLGSPGNSLSNSTTKLRFITNSPQGFMSRTLMSFTQKIAAMSLELQEGPNSPALSSPYRKRALIKPLVKLNYQKGVGKIKDFMNFKLTGKV